MKLSKVFLQLLMMSVFVGGSPQAWADSTTTNNIYSFVELTDRALDVVLRKAKGVTEFPVMKLAEPDLTSQHIYQAYIACLDEVRQLQVVVDMAAMPKVIATPQQYQLGDVKQLAVMLLMEVQQVAIHLNVWGLPKTKYTYHTKTSTDVFNKLMLVQYKLHLLASKDEYVASDIHNELAGSLSDIYIILNNLDSARRYRVNYSGGREPVTVEELYSLALNLRVELNNLRQFWQLPLVNPGPMPAEIKVATAYLLAQCHIIRAEINALKIVNGLRVSTTETIGQGGHGWGDIKYQLSFLAFLAKQIPAVSKLPHE